MSAPPAHPRRTARGPAVVRPPRVRPAVYALLLRWTSGFAPSDEELVVLPRDLVERAVALARIEGWADAPTRHGVVRLLLMRAVRTHGRG